MSDWLKIDPFAHLGKKSRSSGSGLALEIFNNILKSWTAGAERARIEKDRQAERARQDAILRNPPPVHGSARWATAADLRPKSILRPTASFDDSSSLLLGVHTTPTGQVEGQLHWDGEGHLMTVAPTRSGKSTTVIIPNLVRYKGACVVLDPKGELYAHTAAWRRENVGPVYRIAPFAREGEEAHGFNPLAMIRTPADARALADLMLPEDPRAQQFFKKDAVSFLTALILHVVTSAPENRRNLFELRRLTALALPDFIKLVRIMAKSPQATVANAANIVLGKSADRGLPSLRETLNTDLSLWDDPGVQAASARADVDFHALKDQPATVYITVPFDKMDAYSPFLKVLLTTALEAMVQNDRLPNIPVLFVLDEFLSLGPFPKFRDAIRTHAGAGVRLWFFLQDVSTLEEHYPSSWKAFFNASVKMFFGTDEGFTGELISKNFLGPRTVAYTVGSLGTNRSSSSGNVDPHANHGGTVSQSVNLAERPLLNAQEVVKLLSGAMNDGTRYGLAFMRDAPPIKMVMVPWFLGKSCKERVQSSQTRMIR